jgi:hypothetical protein
MTGPARRTGWRAFSRPRPAPLAEWRGACESRGWADGWAQAGAGQPGRLKSRQQRREVRLRGLWPRPRRGMAGAGVLCRRRGCARPRGPGANEFAAGEHEVHLRGLRRRLWCAPRGSGAPPVAVVRRRARETALRPSTVILKEARRATFRQLRLWRRRKNPAPHLAVNAGSHPAPNCQARAGGSVARCRTAARRRIRSGILRSRMDRLGGECGARFLRMTAGAGTRARSGPGVSTPFQDDSWRHGRNEADASRGDGTDV